MKPTGQRVAGLLCGLLIVVLFAQSAFAALPAFADAKAAFVSSEALLVDRNGAPLSEKRVDPRVRRLDWIALADVWHKAFVRVDEQGTEAAAATVVSMARCAAAPPAPPREVRFDRPFWFVLRHLPSGAVLFAGKVMDPR